MAARTSCTENEMLLQAVQCKRCCKCRKIKPLADFNKYQADWSRHTPICRLCDTARVKAYYKTHRTERLNYTKQKKYGIPPEVEKALIQTQGNKCAICRNEFHISKNRHIDHCHTTNRIRGILCSNCNLLLGHAKDTVSILIRAAAYLNGH